MNAKIDERRGHTSASNAEADALCPGRHLAQAGLPETDSAYASSGRKIHNALALRNPEGLTLAERETYDRCLDIEARKVAEFFGTETQIESWAEDPNNLEGSRFWVRFQYNGRMLEHSCRPDRFHRSNGKRALIIEYKTLLGDVPESARNMQLRDQQVILRGHYLITGDIGVVVIQPFVEMNPQICVYTAEDSDRARQEMFARVIASNDPQSARTAGEVQCKFCRAKRHCIEYQKFHGQLTPPAMLTVLEVPMTSWTPEQRATAANAIKPAEKLLDEMKEFLKSGLEKDPSFVPGWTLEPGKKRETIKDPQVCYERFAGIGGKLEQFMACISVTKTKLKEAVNTATGARGKALDAAIKTLTDGIVETSVTAPSLKRVSEES